MVSWPRGAVSPSDPCAHARLDPRLVDEAREALGVSTEREAVEMALDLVGFRKDLVLGARALRRLVLSRID